MDKVGEAAAALGGAGISFCFAVARSSSVKAMTCVTQF